MPDTGGEAGETYAAAAAAADAQYAAANRARELDADAAEVMRLLARGTADELAVAGIEGLAANAEAVHATFLDAARSAQHELRADLV